MNKSSLHTAVCTSPGLMAPKWLVSTLVLVTVQAVAGPGSDRKPTPKPKHNSATPAGDISAQPCAQGCRSCCPCTAGRGGIRPHLQSAAR